MTLRPGQSWGRPGAGTPDVEVTGGDDTLAETIAAAPPGALVRFLPDASSDLARALGLAPDASPTGMVVNVDVLALGDGTSSVNAVVLGPPPDRLRWWHGSAPTRVEIDGRVFFDGDATTVVVASGQYLRGRDVIPRGHPGDGRAEIQIYALGRGERVEMRRRLGGGTHVPHPRIRQRSGRHVAVSRSRPGRLEADGRPRGRVTELHIEVVPGALHLAL
jgi:hypothetical protein